MKEIIRYFLIVLIGLGTLYYFNYLFKTSLQDVKTQFDTSEILYLEELAHNIERSINKTLENHSLLDALNEHEFKRQALETTLETIAISKYKYAYVVGKGENGRFVFLLDGAVDAKASFLEPFFSQSKQWEEVFTKGEALYFQEDDVENIWITYLYPLKRNGKVEAILAIDFSKEVISQTLNFFTPLQEFLDNLLLALMGIFALLFLAIFQYLIKNKETQQYKQEVVDTQEFYKEIFDSQNALVITMQNNTITHANDSFFTFFEVYSIQEFENKYKSLLDIIKPLDKDFALNNLTENVSYQVSMLDHTFAVTGKNIVYKNEFLWIVSFNDVTLLEKTKQEATQANRAKSEFLAKMSHEIRTPMNAIIGLTTLMIDSEAKEKNVDYLQKIKTSSNSLLNIINEILDFSKVESGKLELYNTCFALADLVEKLQNMFEFQAQEKGLDFQILVDQSLPKYVVADSTRLEQILVNLLGNAFKFTHEGSIELLIKSSNSSKSNIVFVVKDSGIGIAQQKQSSLFEAFVQADNSITRRYGGSGLGLAITKQIVALMGGTIELESAPDIGTTFTIKLHFEVTDNLVIPVKTSSVSPQKQLSLYKDVSILIAEDNLLNQEVIKGMLKPFNFHLMLVENGELCIQECLKNRYDLIFMDINMPIMGGYEATIKLRELGCEVPVVALSANAREEDVLQSLEYGMVAHISKPIDKDILYSTITQYIGIEKVDIEKSSLYQEDEFQFNYIDANALLEDISANKQLFETLLERYLDDYHTMAIDVAKLFELKNQKETKDYFHKLKSTSGSIRTLELYPLVSSYYESLQTDIEKSIFDSSMITANDKVIKEIKKYFAFKLEHSVKPEASLTLPTESYVDYTDLRFALEGKNFNKIKNSLAQIDVTKLSHESKLHFEKIAGYIKNYKFNDALEVLKNEKNINS